MYFFPRKSRSQWKNSSLSLTDERVWQIWQDYIFVGINKRTSLWFFSQSFTQKIWAVGWQWEFEDFWEWFLDYMEGRTRDWAFYFHFKRFFKILIKYTLEKHSFHSTISVHMGSCVLLNLNSKIPSFAISKHFLFSFCFVLFVWESERKCEWVTVYHGLPLFISSFFSLLYLFSSFSSSPLLLSSHLFMPKQLQWSQEMLLINDLCVWWQMGREWLLNLSYPFVEWSIPRGDDRSESV